MKEMYSETHSCMHSFASFAIFAFSGNADFMILATGAKLRMLASESHLLDADWADCSGECGERVGVDDMTLTQAAGVTDAGNSCSSCGGDVSNEEEGKCLGGRGLVASAGRYRSEARRGLWLDGECGGSSPRRMRSDVGTRAEGRFCECSSNRRQTSQSHSRANQKGRSMTVSRKGRWGAHTIGYWQPSVLFLDFDVVPLCIRVHGLSCALIGDFRCRMFAFSLSIQLLGWGGRHILFGPLQLLSRPTGALCELAVC